MKFFTIKELTKSNEAKRNRINNVPTKQEEQNLIALVENILDPLREAYGKPIIVTSGYRSERLNKAIGGAIRSDHVYGCAADIKTVSDTREDNKKLFDLIIKLKDEGIITCRQIIDEYNLDWIHVSINNKYNKYKEN